MSRRRDSVERYYDREEERLSKQLDAGQISSEDYNEMMRDLQREAQEQARAAMDEDMQDVIDDWRW